MVLRASGEQRADPGATLCLGLGAEREHALLGLEVELEVARACVKA